ncbi:MAG TPA: TIGR03013 family XrtA/PEP-CTERM system glycosyltransferase [Acetobacteraceae bacterium]|jgi:sugar transferase (PEP-CTERM system associated)|nr:TIGR03013 family XrtA/PEP-CTERM system glycosyltransferase [Acetobacteraceae bacterium]
MTASAAMFFFDAVLVALVWPLAAWMAVPLGEPQPAIKLLLPLLLHPAAYLLLLYALGLYRRDLILDTRRALARLPLVVGLSTIAVAVAIGLLRGLLPADLPGRWPSAGALFFVAVVAFSVCGSAARLLFSLLRRRAVFKPRLMVIGAGARAWDLAWMLQHEGRNLAYDIIFIHHPSHGEIDPRLAAEQGGRIVLAEDDLLAVAQEIQADQIVMAPDERRGVALEGLIACKTAGYPVLQYMSFLEKEIRRIDIKRLELSWVLYSDGFYFGLLDRVLKRLLDVSVALVILVAASPFLLASMAAVYLGDRGPIFYRQARVTRGGRVFRIVKLRTMRVDAEARGAVWAAKGDARITRVGNFLRRSRLDEVPQLYNVLKGDMSLVGPRPERPEFITKLAAELPLYNERHMVKAGLTGWAQINYPYGASLDDARSKLSYDLYYVKNFSVLLDLMILLQTIRVVLWPSGVR